MVQSLWDTMLCSVFCYVSKDLKGLTSLSNIHLATPTGDAVHTQCSAWGCLSQDRERWRSLSAGQHSWCVWPTFCRSQEYWPANKEDLQLPLSCERQPVAEDAGCVQHSLWVWPDVQWTDWAPIQTRVNECHWHIWLIQPDKSAVPEQSPHNTPGNQNPPHQTRQHGLTIREATELELYPNSMDKEDGQTLRMSWKPLIQFLRKCRQPPQEWWLVAHSPFQDQTLLAPVPCPNRSFILQHCFPSEPLAALLPLLPPFSSPCQAYLYCSAVSPQAPTPTIHELALSPLCTHLLSPIWLACPLYTCPLISFFSSPFSFSSFFNLFSFSHKCPFCTLKKTSQKARKYKLAGHMFNNSGI